MAERFVDHLVLCPYFPDHRVKESNLLKHVEKCALNPQAPDLKICKYNPAHRLRLIDLDDHHRTCPNVNTPPQTFVKPIVQPGEGHFTLQGLKKMSIEEALERYGKGQVVNDIVYQKWTKADRQEFNRRRNLLPEPEPTCSSTKDSTQFSYLEPQEQQKTSVSDFDKGIGPTLFDHLGLNRDRPDKIDWGTGNISIPPKPTFDEDFPAL